MNTTQKKTQMYFNEGILFVQFFENAVVEAEDVIFIYCYGRDQSKGKPYGLLFDSSGKHEFSEDAIDLFASSTYLEDIIAIAYISKDLLSKIRLNLLMIFERPRVKPKLFEDEQIAFKWLKEKVSAYASISC